MEYAKTKDILHVRQLLGHKRPKTAEEEDELIKAGFEYVRFDDKMQVPIYKKRK